MVQPLTLEEALGQLAEAQARNRALAEENERLRSEASAGRPAKGRSPAVWTFRVLRWEWVDVEIHPRADPVPKTIRALRVHVPLEDQPDGPGYWDITTKRVQAVLTPVLPAIDGGRAYVTFQQDGRGLSSQYSVTIRPVKAP